VKRLATLICFLALVTLGNSITIPQIAPFFYTKPLAVGPVFSSESGTFSETAGTSTTVITLSAAVANRGILSVGYYYGASSETVSSVADSTGNTWSNVSSNRLSNIESETWTSPIVSALSGGDTVTITWLNPDVTFRCGRVVALHNTTAVDTVTTPISESGASPSLSITNTAPAVLFGTLVVNGNDAYTPANGYIQIGSALQPSALIELINVYQNVSASGNIVLGGTSMASTFGESGLSFK